MAADIIDWDLALRTGRRFAPKGPATSLSAARDTVDAIREHARAAVAPVRECTGMTISGDTPEAAVVDRSTWIESNIDAFRFVLAPILDRLRDGTGASGPGVEVGSRATALQLGAILGWLSGKVLGQYEALAPWGAQARLMLVAPNMVEVATVIGADPRDFQLWVCLHEETHRVQFTAVPWLADHFAAEVQSLIVASDVPGREYLKRAGAIAAALLEVLRGRDGATALLRAAQSPEQRTIFDRITALMTLLEGHADVVMDEVGPQVVPSVVSIRASFEQRRQNPGAVDSVVRRLLGMDAKLRQYSEGAAFVRAVTAQVGMGGFNRVWESADTLPLPAEIAAPQLWVARVHG